MQSKSLIALISLLLFALFSLPAVAQPRSDTKEFGGLLWRAEKAHWTLYLYGVDHGADRIRQINPRVRQLIETADIYLSEIPLGKTVAHPEDLKDISREFIETPFVLNQTAESAFKKLHTEGVIGAYQYWALRHQSPLSATRGMYPELLYQQFVASNMRVVDFPKPRLGADRLALNLAHSKRRVTIQIEPEHTADRYWLKNCDNERDNSAYILSMIDVATHHRVAIAKTHQQIEEDDWDGFQASVDGSMDVDFFRLDYLCHVIDRNKFWTQSIERLTRTRETSLAPAKSMIFFTFGAMHAVSPKKFPATSVIDLLIQLGWRIERLKTVP